MIAIPNHGRRRASLYAVLVAQVGTLMFSGQAVRADAPHILNSPDSGIRLNVQMPPPGSPRTPYWSASFHGKSIFTSSRLSLKIAGEGDLLAGIRLLSERSRSSDKRVRVLFAKPEHARDHYRETRFALENRRHLPIDV